MTAPCPCLVAVSLHEDHCCLADAPMDSTMPQCHADEWQALVDRVKAAESGRP